MVPPSDGRRGPLPAFGLRVGTVSARSIMLPDGPLDEWDQNMAASNALREFYKAQKIDPTTGLAAALVIYLRTAGSHETAAT